MSITFSVLVLFFASCNCASTLSTTGTTLSVPPVTSRVTAIIENIPLIVVPGPGSFLDSSENVTGLVMVDVGVEMGTCEEDYHPRGDPPRMVKKGEPCLLVTGDILNTSKDRFNVVMWADGLDQAGEKVSWTLDSAYLVGQTALSVEYGETRSFTIHLNTDDNLKEIRIYATYVGEY